MFSLLGETPSVDTRFHAAMAMAAAEAPAAVYAPTGAEAAAAAIEFREVLASVEETCWFAAAAAAWRRFSLVEVAEVAYEEEDEEYF